MTAAPMPENALLATAGAGDDLLVGYRWRDSGEVHLQHRPTRGEQPEDDARRAFCTRIPALAWEEVCGRLADRTFWADPAQSKTVHLTAGYDHWTFKRAIVQHHGTTLDQVRLRTATDHIIVLNYPEWDGLVTALADCPGQAFRLDDLDAVMTKVFLRRERQGWARADATTE